LYGIKVIKWVRKTLAKTSEHGNIVFVLHPSTLVVSGGGEIDDSIFIKRFR